MNDDTVRIQLTSGEYLVLRRDVADAICKGFNVSYELLGLPPEPQPLRVVMRDE